MSPRLYAFMANSAYLDTFKSPDQEDRRAELRDFFGPNADSFLKVYDRMRDDALSAGNGRPKFRFAGGGFEAAAFFAGPVWFFYRKMWAWAWGLTALLIVLGLIPGVNRVGLPVGIALAFGAHRLYVTYAMDKLKKMRAATGVLNPETVRRVGGVSVLAGWISGGIYALLLALAIIGIIYAARTGTPLPR